MAMTPLAQEMICDQLLVPSATTSGHPCVPEVYAALRNCNSLACVSPFGFGVGLKDRLVLGTAVARVHLLQVACQKGHLNLAAYLLQHRAEVNARDDSGRTALFWAVESGHSAVVELLCEYSWRLRQRVEQLARLLPEAPERSVGVGGGGRTGYSSRGMSRGGPGSDGGGGGGGGGRTHVVSLSAEQAAVVQRIRFLCKHIVDVNSPGEPVRGRVVDFYPFSMELVCVCFPVFFFSLVFVSTCLLCRFFVLF